MNISLQLDTRDADVVFRGQIASGGAEAGTDVEDVLGGLDADGGGAVVEGGIAVVVHAVEGGGVGVCPGGEVGEGREGGVGAGEGVEGHFRDVVVFDGFGFARVGIVGGVHCLRVFGGGIEYTNWVMTEYGL